MKKVVLGIICVCLIAVGAYQYSFERKKNVSFTAETVAVKTQNLYNSVVAQGSVVGSKRQTVIFSESSNILDIYVRVGQRVRKGDKLLLRRSVDAKNSSFQVFANQMSSLLSNYGIDMPLVPTIHDRTALITSELDGIVTKLHAKKDESFPGYTVAVEICDQTVCTVIAEIPELYSSSIKVGQKATVKGAAFTKESYEGIVTAISHNARKKMNLAGEGTTYLPIEIKLSNADASLKQGCTATVKIQTAEKKNALVLPYDCIMQDIEGKEIICVQNKDGKIEIRRVLTGLELEDQTEILYGIKQGEIVLRNPDALYKSGGKNG